MKFDALLKDVECIAGSDLFPEITKIVKDAKNAEQGALYICIQGISGDGHDHIAEAVANGAVAVVCERDAEIPGGIAAARVKSARQAQSFICRNFYGNPTSGMNIVGITGTNGKTSTTYFIEGILRVAGRNCGIIGTSGLRINGESRDFKFATSTTPDSIELYEIFRLLQKGNVTDIAMEATSHALALDKLCALEFEQAVFTNLTRDHLDFHKTFDAYFDAKLKLFRQAKSSILNIDDEISGRIAKTASGELYSFGIEKACDFRAENVRYTAEGSFFDVKLEGIAHSFFLPIPGRFSVYNALGAIASAYLSGFSADIIEKGLNSVRVIPGRIQTVDNNKGIGVIVDYAHTPDGLEKVIDSVRTFTERRIITVFGCGGDRDRVKRPIMGKISGQLSDFCIVTSDNPRSEEPEDIIAEIIPGLKESGCGFIAEPDRRKAIFKAVAMAERGDTVLVAGKGHETYQELKNKQRIDFDDRLVAIEALDIKEG